MADPVMSPRVCIDRPSSRPPAPARPHRPGIRLAVPVDKKWANGRRLKVGFLDGPEELHTRIAEVAEEWVIEASLRLDWGAPVDEADIKVFFEGVGSWSQIGNDASHLPPGEASLCLGWIEPDTPDGLFRQTVLHEFGHALGAVHEHQSPAGGVPWDRPAVYSFYSGPPNQWSQAEVDANLFDKYDATITQFSEFDPDSIMIYPVPDELTVGSYEVDWGTDLSAMDRRWMGVAYPIAPPDPHEMVIDGQPVQASIREHGEWDEFPFRVDADGKVIVETSGPTDVVIALAGPDDPELIVAQDDDSGQDHNARVEAVVQPGGYVVRVWHHWPTGVGPYEVSVRRE